jgi:hypothetical protein
MQFAGFRIDIVYDPKVEGLPKVAIECDGASYHSSREAYLYDYYRQKVLESHGFVFHRIWSTNWWQQPKVEEKRLIQFLQNIQLQKISIFEHSDDNPSQFSDDTVDIRKVIVTETVGNKSDVESTKQTSKEKSVQPDLFSQIISANKKVIAPADKETLKSDLNQIIKPNSKVKVKYLNNNKDLYFKLVDIKPKNINPSEKIQKLFIKSPLATSILGKSVGDTIKIGGLDNYVEIIEVK